MNIDVYPEAYINSTTDVSLTNTHNAILCRNILKKYENEILNNKEGCLFKLIFNEQLEENQTWTFVNYISCIEFTAPDNTGFISNMVFEDLSSKVYTCLKNVSIEPFYPPQATQITFDIKEELLKLSPDLKYSLESILTKKYKFLKIGQQISFFDNYITISELKPYEICLVNNTDVDVKLNIIKKNINNNLITESCQNKIETSNTSQSDSVDNSPSEKLTQQELRNKRIQALDKKKI